MLERFEIVAVNPDRSHDDVWFNTRAVQQWLGVSPDVMRKVGSSISKICSVDERERIDQTDGDGNRDEKCRYYTTGSIFAISCESPAYRMRWSQNWSFSGASDAELVLRQARCDPRMTSTYPLNGYNRYQIIFLTRDKAWFKANCLLQMEPDDKRAMEAN